jgi:hypothetical protein
MAHEQLKNATLTRSLSDVIADLSTLFQKEMELARAEIGAKITNKLQGGIWIMGAALLAVMALVLVLEAVVFGIASYGIAIHWSCLIVAAGVGLASLFAYFLGKQGLSEDLTPDRTIRQVKQDLAVTKERLT